MGEGALEQFQEKCAAVFRAELRQNERLERFRGSEKSGNALEVLRPDKRHDQIDRERDGDDEPDQSLGHRTLLKPAQGARIKRERGKAANTGSKEKKIGHGHSPDLSKIRMMRPRRVNYRLGWFGGHIKKR